MSRKLVVKLGAILAAVAIASGLVVIYIQYIHPNVRGRSTEELRSEVVLLVTDHLNEPILLRLPSIERQSQISAELSQRTDPRIAEWQAQEAAEEAIHCQSEDIASAVVTPIH